ncbi:MAG: Na+/H+ antiporter, probable [uncultured bacterium (gcode 4)]|uniref:Na+/H+ antiporter, probable n=1 Tax=uncultured bacterium (gcode 4) TaxID=1234023 RepID=K1XWC8_9BACT|nr:MAG: Na+/H+ antiporter, probable [uncultured bacterium (gcode 4)]
MDWLWIVMWLIFVFWYAMIALEHRLHINKSWTAILLWVVLRILVDIFYKFSPDVGIALSHETQEIFGIVVFLLAAMTLVEILVHYRLFDRIQQKITEKKISQAQLFRLLWIMTFIFSALLDNLTTTLIMIQIGRKIYTNKENFLLYVANVIIAANAGGAASPIGDVTTIMLRLANKFTAGQIITMGMLPAIMTRLIPQFLMWRKIKHHEEVEKKHIIKTEKKIDMKWYRWIIIVAVVSFTIPVFANLVWLPPFLWLLTWVGLLRVIIDLKAKNWGDNHHHEWKVMNIIQKTDITTLKFFIWILLAVAALSEVGILKALNTAIFNTDPSIRRLVIGNTILWFTSSILDNVPLVAAAIKMFPPETASSIRVLLALTAWTWWSMLVIGSAAGVAAMGQVKELTFIYYLKKAALPALLWFLWGIGIWIIMNIVF